jgi:hypothetical protein
MQSTSNRPNYIEQEDGMKGKFCMKRNQFSRFRSGERRRDSLNFVKWLGKIAAFTCLIFCLVLGLEDMKIFEWMKIGFSAEAPKTKP